MELLEMLENIEAAYHNLAVHYAYVLKLDTAKRKENIFLDGFCTNVCRIW